MDDSSNMSSSLLALSHPFVVDQGFECLTVECSTRECEAEFVLDSQALPEMVIATANVGVSAQGDKTRLKNEDFAKILDWLEIPENFAMLKGTARRLPVGARHPSKKTVFRIMLVVLHSQGFPKEITTGENLGKRFGRYEKKYKEALALKSDSGAGLSESEMRQRISFEDKLNRICPHFDRMHSIFGERANVNPPMLAAAGLPNHVEVYHESVSDEEDLEDIDGSMERLPNESPDLTEDVAEFQPPPMTPVGKDLECGMNESETPYVSQVPEREAYADHPPRPTPTTSGAASQSTPNASAQPSVEDPVVRTSGVTPPSANAQKKKRPVPGAVQGSNRPNMVDLYAEKLCEKASYRVQMIETKDKWRTQELIDRREARAALAKHEMKKESLARIHEVKRTRMERQHQLQLVQAEQTTKLELGLAEHTTRLLTELIKSGRSEGKVRSLMNLLKTPRPTFPGSSQPCNTQHNFDSGGQFETINLD